MHYKIKLCCVSTLDAGKHYESSRKLNEMNEWTVKIQISSDIVESIDVTLVPCICFSKISNFIKL